jgi:hypothetical protein
LSPRVQEAEDALVRWKASLIRARRWAKFCCVIVIVSITIGGLEIVGGHRPFAGFLLLVTAFVAFVRYEFVFERRRDEAKNALVIALRTLDYGDDGARATSRALLQSMMDFESC